MLFFVVSYIYARFFFCSIQCYSSLSFSLLSVFRLLSCYLFCSLWALLPQFLSKAKLNFFNWKEPIYIFCPGSELLFSFKLDLLTFAVDSCEVGVFPLLEIGCRWDLKLNFFFLLQTETTLGLSSYQQKR